MARSRNDLVRRSLRRAEEFLECAKKNLEGRLSFFVKPPLVFSVSIASALLTIRTRNIGGDVPYEVE